MKDPTVYLRHILDAIVRIETYAAAGQEAFRAEPMRQDAIVRNLEIIGEAVRQLPAEFHAEVPGVDWGAAIGMRNWLIHGYAVVDLGIVWQPVTGDVPAMRNAVEGLPGGLGWAEELSEYRRSHAVERRPTTPAAEARACLTRPSRLAMTALSRR